MKSLILLSTFFLFSLVANAQHEKVRPVDRQLNQVKVLITKGDYCDALLEIEKVIKKHPKNSKAKELKRWLIAHMEILRG